MATVAALMADSAPVAQLSEKYRLADLVRLKDEVGSEESGRLEEWEIHG
jgi:hypothetical protein